MARPRSVTIENLNKLIKEEDYVVVSRDNNPNYCNIKFKLCNHTKLKTISSISDPLKRKTYCLICFEEDLRKILESKEFMLLTKLNYGDNKFSGEYRLCMCNKCGNFVFILPNSIRTSENLHCSICEYYYYRDLAQSKKYTLINRIDRYNLLLECGCGYRFSYQGSNLRRVTPRCPNCGKKDNGSYVYAYLVENPIGKFIKIGKSNNPYLRHLNFSENKLNSYYFIGRKSFDTECEAYKFEKELFIKYSTFRLSSEFSKLFMDSGFTEMFSEDIIECVRKELENY